MVDVCYVGGEDAEAETGDEEVEASADEEGGEDYEGGGDCVGWLSRVLSLASYIKKDIYGERNDDSIQLCPGA